MAVLIRADTATQYAEHMLTYLLIAYWIAFGPHGPRSLPPPGEKTKIFAYTMIGIGVAAVIFFSIGAFARPPPHTMTKEWQEATNEYLKVRHKILWL